jgi:protease-4
VQLRAAAELEPKNNAGPLVEMPVAGQPCGPGRPKVAVIDLDGLLLNVNLTGPYSTGENPVDLFCEKLNRAASDPAVCALVLRINSPGGAATATDIMWQELRAFRARTQRPVVACLMDMGCSGAYYLATASDLILAHPTSVTGGVGVVLNLYNLEDFLGAFNVRAQFVKAGKNIDMGSMVKSLDPEAKAMLQGTTLDGRVFGAQEALERGLIDRVGYLMDAVAAARELARQPDAGVVLFHRCNDLARTPYATTPNVPLQASLLPVSIPGIERSRWPTFLYLWQPDPTLERLSGR